MKNDTLVVPGNATMKLRRKRQVMLTAGTIRPLCSTPSKPCALGYAQLVPECCPSGGPQPGPYYYQQDRCCSTQNLNNDFHCIPPLFDCMRFGWEVQQCNSPSAWCPCQTAGYCKGFVCVPRKIMHDGTECKVQQSDSFAFGMCLKGLCVYNDASDILPGMPLFG